MKSRVESGVVVLDYQISEADVGWRHTVHGGISMTLLDEVMTWAAILAGRRPCLAAEINVRLRRTIGVGSRLRVEGRAVGGKARLILTEGRILDLEGATLATASGKYIAMPAEQFQICKEDFVTAPETIDPRDLFEFQG